MDKEGQRFDALWDAELEEPSFEAREAMLTLFVLVSFSAVLLTTFTERFSHLPGTLVALTSAWWILRL